MRRLLVMRAADARPDALAIVAGFLCIACLPQPGTVARALLQRIEATQRVQHAGIALVERHAGLIGRLGPTLRPQIPVAVIGIDGVVPDQAVYLGTGHENRLASDLVVTE